jgi:hypothetical protein
MKGAGAGNAGVFWFLLMKAERQETFKRRNRYAGIDACPGEPGALGILHVQHASAGVIYSQ